MPYLNVDEVESALSVVTSAPYTAFTQLIVLPNLTWEGRQCHAIKIANGSNPGRPGVYFLGGVHAREWGSADILINFVEQLEQAYLANVGITLGGKTFSASDIQTIVNTLDIVVFPQANPDGRKFSMTNDIDWRKNRRTLPPNSNSGSCVGVDVNRNYDFLWDFPTYFNPSSPIIDSTDPCHPYTYHGPAAFSEPETNNAKWIFDTFANIGFFIDLHSFGEDILYSWGDDEDQTTNPSMNYQNAAYNGLRGLLGDSTYKEYIPSSDLSLAIDLANTLRDGIQPVRGKNYKVEQSFTLIGVYPTAGTSDDYAYSRHFVDNTKEKVIAYTIEWGTEFQPPYTEMQNIIQEITSGLLAFCLWVRNSLKHCTFIIERSTLGQDEIDARRQTGSPVIQDAFRIVVDGFAAAELGISGPSSTLNVASPIGGMTINCTGNTSDNGDYGTEIQRFTFNYDINFPDDSAFNFTGPTEFVTLNVTAGGIFASGQLELIKQPNPFILHGDPAWLSIDLRVFVVRAGQTKFGVTMGADASAAPAFIQQVMEKLTTGHGKAGGETFVDSLPTDESAKLFVYPNDNNGTKVFNFALAKVHYIGLIGAANVRVFFHLFQAQTTSGAFDYPPGGQYRRALSNPNGQPIPLAGIQGNEYVTIPCFAAARVDSTVVSMDQQTDDFNRQNFTAIGGPEVDGYFGCWLDINQPFKVDGVTPNNVLPINTPATNVNGPFTDPSNPPLTIQQAILRNPHQCLIAEIAFDPVVIPIGKDPSNWDKLAQRNIAWSDIGSAQALTTFEIRPTPRELQPGQTPDELMIDWGAIPNGSVATIYLPAVNVADVLAMAAKMYTSDRLVSVDGHTLECRTGGITYVPIPPGSDINYAGLLSVDLSAKVRKDQVFNIVVRQVTDVFGKQPPPPPQPPGISVHTRPAASTAIASAPRKMKWRRVLGAFQLTIPVKTKELLLVTEERQLSVLRWIAEAIPHQNRWYPVFSRYLEQIAGRVSVLGGDPALIGPSPTGEWRKPRPPGGRGEERIAFTGKIAGLIFDHFGDFEGFLLDTEDGERKFFSREKEVEELSERAWRERLRITVWAERHEPRRPLSIIVREPPAPFRG
jgi:hypothetical protein